jgi:hypothetical protein
MGLNFTTNSPTITAASLAFGTARCSAPVTVTAANPVFAINLEVSILTTTTAPTANKQVVVYAYASPDGTNYNGGSTTEIVGADAAITLASPTNLIYLGVISKNTGATAATIKGTFEITSKLGYVPKSWGFVLLNDDGAANLGATVTAIGTELYYS